MVQNLTLSIPNRSMFASTPLDSPITEILSEMHSFSDTPLTCLSKATRNQLSELLNRKKVLRSEEGYERDWRGIAVLAQQNRRIDETTISSDKAMDTVLKLWCSHNPTTATFANLEKYLGIIDRWDVCDDIYENLVKDANNHKEKASIVELDQPDSAFVDDTNIENFGFGSDRNILTKEDVECAQKGLPLQKYDAFVLFANEDISYAAEMIVNLEENPKYNLKLCMKDRNLLAGVSFAHEALTELIEKRCRHLVVILTRKFLQSSPENQFLVSYTQMVQIQHNTRKIIPLLYEDAMIIPRTLKIYTHLKYNVDTNNFFNFWGKLSASILSVESSLTQQPLYVSQQSNVKRLSNEMTPPTPTNDVPSIVINGPDDDVPKEKINRPLYKHNHSVYNAALKPCPGMRTALSTSVLNEQYRDSTHASMSDLSTTSFGEIKKKKKWRFKSLKKVFSRSSNRLPDST